MIKFLISSLLITSLYAQIINLDTSLQVANQTNKTVLIFLHKNGCGYCNAMEEFTLDDDEIKKFISLHFIYVSINISQNIDIIFHKTRQSGLEFAKEIGYNFYPTILFLDRDGELLDATVGYKENTEFLQFLHYIRSSENDTLSFEEYKHQTTDTIHAKR